MTWSNVQRSWLYLAWFYADFVMGGKAAQTPGAWPSVVT
jgi:hypothetical protein